MPGYACRGGAFVNASASGSGGTLASGEEGDGADAVAGALARVRDDIERFATRYGRRSETISLLAVSKTKPVAAIEAAVAAGQRAFGENYVDEALGKIETLGGAPLEWHYVGTIQSRRCEAIAERFDWAHGVDREKVARRLSERRPEGAPPLNVCLQLDIDGEESKGGVAPDVLDALADFCAGLPGIRLRGLMAIPAPRDALDEQRRAFALVRERFEALRARGFDTLDTLSIGMSGDLEAAIAEGATLVRIGTAVFGARPPKS